MVQAVVIAIITAGMYIILASLLQTMTIQCASRIVVAHNVARQTIMVTTGAMNYLVTIIYYVILDAAICMANASVTTQGVG